MKKLVKRVLTGILSMSMVVGSLMMPSIPAFADEDTYAVSLSASETTVEAGSTITVSAEFTKNGSAYTPGSEDGDSNSYTLWNDHWDDHSTGKSDASISSEHATSTSVTLPTAGTYYLVGTIYDSSWNKLANDCVTITVTDATETTPTPTPTASADEYTVTVSPSEKTVTAGDTVSVTATVKLGDTEITDLSEAGLELWFWADTWDTGHSEGLTDITLSDSTGTSLTNDITVASAGTYYICVELQKDSTTKAKGWLTITSEGPSYTLTVTPSTTTPSKGDKVTMTAKVTTGDGTEMSASDLETAGLYIKWTSDNTEEGHTEGKTDAKFTVDADTTAASNTVQVLTQDVTLPSKGLYYIGATLVDEDDVAQISDTVYTSFNTEATVGDITVEKIDNLRSDFIMGVDVSSVISLLNSGVKYYDYEGNDISNVDDFVAFLASQGITHVRVRVWNDPYDSNGNGYGGGNNDVAKAATLAAACEKAGIKMLVDFHCSDLWTDPGKYQAPKAWASYTVDEKATALTSFIKDSLNTIDPDKTVVDMVQVGNETTTGFIGVTDKTDMCTLFNAGAAGVRSYNDEVKVVIHLTNPEKGTMTSWAKTLDDNSVDYDVLATSYYPYWHGTLANLKSQMETVEETYGKGTMVAETSYAYTLDDSDGHDNTVRVGNNDGTSGTTYCTEDFCEQGQATSVRNLMAAVNEAGGLGVFYWEPAWLTVGDTTGLEGDEYDAQVAANKLIWEANGSGWASSYAGEYDSKDAGKWYGGSAVDNEALFYADGTPSPSWHVWNYVKTGSVSTAVYLNSVTNATEKIIAGSSYTLPTTVAVVYSDETVDESVTWNAADVAAIDASTAGTYVVNGTVTLSKTVDAGRNKGKTTATVKYTLTVEPQNMLTDSDIYGFEDTSNFTLVNMDWKAGTDVHAGSSAVHWYNAAATDATVTCNQGIELQAGKYKFYYYAQGASGDKVSANIVDQDGTAIATGSQTELDGWRVWKTPEVTFTLTETTTVYLQGAVSMNAGGWGSLDDMYLCQLSSATVTPTPIVTPSSDNSSSSDDSSSSDSSSEDASSDDTSVTIEESKGGTITSTGEQIKTVVNGVTTVIGNGFKLDTTGTVSSHISNTSVGAIKGADFQVETQGPLCRAAFQAATPQGFTQAFTFNMTVNSTKVDQTRKYGTIEFSIPTSLQKKGRRFMLIAMGKNGVPILYQNLSSNGTTIKANINVQGYAFQVIYMDRADNSTAAVSSR